ncbi:TAP42-like protein [Gyrodon lividus]|nr:TAP42-like protein [Gyrodon lividus]
MSTAPPALPAQYTRALSKASKAVNLPTVDDETQELIREALSDLIQLNSRVANLSLFSPNETLEDISTRDLVYLSIPYIRAEVQNRVRTTDRDERLNNLTQTQSHMRTYVCSLETFDIVSETEHALYAQQPSSIRDAAKRREVKIKQYKAERDLRTRIELVRKRQRQLAPEDCSFNEFDLIASLLSFPGTTLEDDDDNETDDILREAALLLLRLCYAQAYPQLESMNQEMELLRKAPPPPPESPSDERQSRAEEQEDMWKIDLTPLPGKGPLLDPAGKPLRPFTILPAGASDRPRLQAQVFGPGHRLPTMSIDDYLKIERQRGGIISGGGTQTETESTSSEQLTRNSELDGSVFGEMKAEEKRQKDEEWAQYKDAHARGAGNTMNRG